MIVVIVEKIILFLVGLLEEHERMIGLTCGAMLIFAFLVILGMVIGKF